MNSISELGQIWNNIHLTWNNISMNHSDPRTSHFFLMSSPLPSALICLLYVVFVLYGPTLMKDRKAFSLKNILIVYNFSMVILSAYLFYEFLMSGWLFDYSLSCQPVDFSTSPKAMRMVYVCYLFYISKFIELLDTVFFIMRKKFNQVSFLHVFHHGIMPVSWWFGVKFVPGGFGTFHALLNSFIHFLMYAYYGFSAFGTDRFRPILALKKYMTTMQMIQFLLVMIHSAQLIFIKCDYPILFVYWIGSYAIIFLIFFANFYVQTYNSKQQSKSKKSN